MVVNRLHKDLITSRIALSASRLNCQKKICSNGNFYFSDIDFYSENNKAWCVQFLGLNSYFEKVASAGLPQCFLRYFFFIFIKNHIPY
jgi:hypothetical protein